MKKEIERDKRAVMYLRVASSSSGIQVELQRAACQRIAERHGVTIVREYIDFGKPARLVAQTELQRLLTDVEQKQDTAFVVVADLSRLARNPNSLQVISRLLRNAGAEIATDGQAEIAGEDFPGIDIR